MHFESVESRKNVVLYYIYLTSTRAAQFETVLGNTPYKDLYNEKNGFTPTTEKLLDSI
jgi:hypothetical protein